MSQVHSEKVITVGKLSEMLKGVLIGDGGVSIDGVNSIDRASSSEICFAASKKVVSKIGDSQAAAVLVSEQIDDCSKPQILVKDVNAALIEVLNFFAPELTVTVGVHPSAVVEDSAVLGEGVSIGANVYISHGVKIGNGCVIGANSSVGENSEIGDGTRLDCSVVVYHNCRIGRHCVIQSNCTIGAVGFGYEFIDGQHRLIPHNGGVLIEDCVEIGASTTVDRAKFNDTVVGAGTKIDNHVQVAHNCIVGRCCLLVSYVALAGSCVLGDGVVMAGRSGVADAVKVGDGVIIGAAASVFQDAPAGAKLLGMPGKDAKLQLRIYSILNRLPKMYKQLRDVLSRVDKLESSKDN
jgi:UDP-3-O-[3-hydroxymyristoyl] glucosamine N-acyltransferase